MTEAETSLRRRRTLFHERRGYRRRRQIDGARLLPLLGVVLLAVPLLWPRSGDPEVAAVPMSSAITYIFGVWALLILGGLAVGLAARYWGQDGQGPTPPEQDNGAG